MNATPETQAQQGLVRMTRQGRGGMLLTDTYVVTQPVVFDLERYDSVSRLLKSVGNVPSAETEERSHALMDKPAIRA